MSLERPLYSFTLPGAASCQRMVSCAGGIFTDICPKPGLQKAVTHQNTHDFGRAGTPTVLGRLSQGWAEMEGGDPSSRHESPPSDTITEPRDDPAPQGANPVPSLVIVGVHILQSPRPLLQHNLSSQASGFVEILFGPACGVLTYSAEGQERQEVPE